MAETTKEKKGIIESIPRGVKIGFGIVLLLVVIPVCAYTISNSFKRGLPRNRAAMQREILPQEPVDAGSVAQGALPMDPAEMQPGQTYLPTRRTNFYLKMAIDKPAGQFEAYQAFRVEDSGNVGDDKWFKVSSGDERAVWVSCATMPRVMLGPPPPPPPAPPAPQPSTLSAAVRFENDRVMVWNRDTFDWVDVEITINPDPAAGGYALKADLVKADSVFSVGSAEFATAAGERFNPATTKPLKVAISSRLPNGWLSWENTL